MQGVIQKLKVHGSTVVWGCVLQAGMLLVWFLKSTLEFFVDLIVLATLQPWGWLSLLQKRLPWVDPSWNVMAHSDAREGKWRGNRRIEWVAITLHTTLEHGVSNITAADVHNSTASSRLNWRHRRFKWTRPFRQKTKSGFCACAITFQPTDTFLGGKGGRYIGLGTLSPSCADCLEIWGRLRTSWSPKGLSSPVHGLLCL
jgi:hypothetical protein